MAPMASHDHSKQKERNIPVLGLVLKPLYDLFRPHLYRFEVAKAQRDLGGTAAVRFGAFFFDP